MPSKQGPRLFWRLSNLEHPNADLDQTVRDHLLNHSVQVLFPYERVDKELQEELDVQLVSMLPPDEGYQVIRASLADILAAVLSSQVLGQEGASLQAVSLADRLDSGLAAALTPDGCLHLALGGEAYARLGLQGRHSPSCADRYNVTVDLRAAGMEPGQDRYAQVLSKLRTTLPPQAFIVRLEVGGQLRSLGLPREALTPGYGTESWMPLQSEHRTQPGLVLPPLERAAFEALGVRLEPGAGGGGGGGGPRPVGARQEQGAAAGEGGPVEGGAQQQQQQQLQPQQPALEQLQAAVADEEGEGAVAATATAAATAAVVPLTPMQDFMLRRAVTGLHTWLSSLACGMGHAACNDQVPAELMPPELEHDPLPSREEQERRILGTVVSRRWKGMVSQGQVAAVMKATSALVATRAVPWAVVHVWGFADTPVAWRGHEHGVGAWGGAGESCYSCVFMQGGDYCLFKPLGPEDVRL
ncbi:hypothetical protein CHLRE_09g406550v5 [Chlamydomonas reinhardtii]|uniref:Uncharacterized protein n=1 Tax=Chlamydomonas reinhardtii TaxID=3055 RepID=A0A2K3DFA9_CHLRE|nr:uncharacterized protein CHLRE_09g406550v5 [Chlamydomonas reinhardtii]PNW79218.1 hypothetical protein CHLRE_09g406550v5 [Chlamydomonas reinhardtii]